MKWKIVDEKYLDYLRNNFDKRIPYSNYGDDKYKPFFGELFRVNDVSYLTQVSSPKQRHKQMKNALDFIKIYDLKNPNRILGVVNLNYMFPCKTSKLIDLDYKYIDLYRSFQNSSQRSRYINLLKKEMQYIRTANIEAKAEYLYQYVNQNPDSYVSKRCLNFKQLEMACCSY